MKSVLLCVLLGLAFAAAEVIDNTPCNVGRDAQILGESHEVSVDPCPGAADGEPCRLFRGSNATVSIDFTPSITFTSSARVKSTIAWVKSRNTDMTFRGMRPDACQYMECPPRANRRVTFAATLSLGSNLPTGVYPLKVKIQELRGSKRVIACQLFTIKLEDPEE